MMCPYMKTSDGFEMQFGTNHLGHFLLTNLLLDKLKGSAPSRIINLSSLAHTFTKGIDYDKMSKEKSYSPLEAYSQSKLANVLFSRELSKRLQGTGVTVNSVHPGGVATELGRYFPGFSLLSPFLSLVGFKTPWEGAQTSINCAVEESLENVTGKYFSDCAVNKKSEAAQDDDAARALWEMSVKMAGL
ncbi:retinol dehydrogenase 14-like [Crassostrea virginica]